jgi:MFS family permease
MHILTHISKRVAGYKLPESRPKSTGLLIGLIIPAMMASLNFSMFSVVLPSVQDHYQIQADQTAWVFMAYLLPFVIFMPLYGRLGDGLGRRRLFLAGIAIFMVGTGLTLLAPSLGWLMAGWAIQGLGSAGIIPLSVAIITQLFPFNEWGKMIGTWSSVAPLMGIVGPLLGGLLIDTIGWQMVFVPVLIVGLVALPIARGKVPFRPGSGGLQPGFLRFFDWGGVALLGATMLMATLYASSRPITGVAALQDWRLLASALVFLGGFIYWEKGHINPFVPLDIFSNQTLRLASLIGLIRLFTMSGVVFLIPLYLRDVRGLTASAIGTMLTVHAVALLPTLRLGGLLADRWGSRWQVVGGLMVQAGVMVYFSFVPQAANIWWPVMGLVIHGLVGGSYVAALDRAAMGSVAPDQKGMAAGIYSMIRVSGFVFGTALIGVLLQNSLERLPTAVAAYQVVFWFIAGVAMMGGIGGLKLRLA